MPKCRVKVIPASDGQSGIGIRVSPVPLVTDKSGITQLGFFLLRQLTLRRGLYHL
jgi:hypothetical protein